MKTSKGAKPIRIDNWRTVQLADIFTAPELSPIGLSGTVAAGFHPIKPAGGDITTSEVVTTAGRLVTTRSGTVYRLGRVERGFRKWLRELGLRFDRHQPVKVARREGAPE